MLMLHGFGVSRFFWNAQVEAVAEARFFTWLCTCSIRRHTRHRGGRSGTGRCFCLVGHDWGASLALQTADQHHERLASLTILSRPHPLSLARALALPNGDARRSGHHTTVFDADAGPNILANNANWLRTRLTANGVPSAAIEAIKATAFRHPRRRRGRLFIGC